ncbi:hypothetical protein [Legionella steigerwaltii]|uniref:hypothetical protein n=1 Tax=Legionella steigerwaltii TaxID=460 RepID=UPI000B2BF8AF|nr:hypothetical protein [Legionella steigerwaltii]
MPEEGKTADELEEVQFIDEELQRYAKVIDGFKPLLFFSSKEAGNSNNVETLTLTL